MPAGPTMKAGPPAAATNCGPPGYCAIISGPPGYCPIIAPGGSIGIIIAPGMPGWPCMAPLNMATDPGGGPGMEPGGPLCGGC